MRSPHAALFMILVVIGVAWSGAVAWYEYAYEVPERKEKQFLHVVRTVRTLQQTVPLLLDEPNYKLQLLFDQTIIDSPISQARLRGPGLPQSPLIGAWTEEHLEGVAKWEIPADAEVTASIDYSKHNLVTAPFIYKGKRCAVEVWLSEHYLKRKVYGPVLGKLSAQWILVAVLCVSGFLLSQRMLPREAKQEEAAERQAAAEAQ